MTPLFTSRGAGHPCRRARLGGRTGDTLGQSFRLDLSALYLFLTVTSVTPAAFATVG